MGLRLKLYEDKNVFFQNNSEYTLEPKLALQKLSINFCFLIKRTINVCIRFIFENFFFYLAL